MPVEAAPRLALPDPASLIAEFGDEYLSIQSLFRFCFVPGGRLAFLKELAVEEDWGDKDYALLRYLAVHVRLAVEQGRYVLNEDQIILTAGRLATPAGNPIYLGLVRNSVPEEKNPWVLNWVGERPSCTELPEPADLGPWPELDPRREVVVAVDLSGDERRPGLRVIAPLPAAGQLAALSGAVHWALYRGLAVRQIYAGGRGYFVPVYLASREDVAAAPDLVAPVHVQSDRLIVRALLDPEVAYPSSRAVVERWEQLPGWLLDAWDEAEDDSQ